MKSKRYRNINRNTDTKIVKSQRYSNTDTEIVKYRNIRVTETTTETQIQKLENLSVTETRVRTLLDCIMNTRLEARGGNYEKVPGLLHEMILKYYHCQYEWSLIRGPRLPGLPVFGILSKIIYLESLTVPVFRSHSST